MRYANRILAALALLSLPTLLQAADPWVVYEGGDGPGKGKHIVLVSGDEEYRSEEALPQLARILAKHHGFKCTVLFAIDKKTGVIDPNIRDNIPGLEKLADADLLVLFTRFRDPPDDQMKHIADYVNAGKPIVAMRTSTHAFNVAKGKTYRSWSFNEKGGFGKKVLGETWVSHHGKHGSQSTRGLIAKGQAKNPIVRGIKDGDIWGPTDVYGINLPLPGDSQPVIMGEVLVGMKKDDKPLEGKKNEPMMPVAWTKTYKSEAGKSGRVFTTTMGASQDLSSAGLRRLLVNACYWGVGLEEAIPAESNVEIVGVYKPTPFGFGKFTKGVKPEDLKLKK